MALPLSHSITMTPLGIVALCSAVAMVFYFTGRLWSEKGERIPQEDRCLQAGTNKRFVDLHRHRKQPQSHKLIHVALTKVKDEPPRYDMAADLTSNEIDGVALFQVLAMVRAAMEKLNNNVLDNDRDGQKRMRGFGR